jgi:hypothetical protein
MKAEMSKLRSLCRPNRGTSTEIVFSAWELARVAGLSAEDILTQLDPPIASSLGKAAEECQKKLPEDGLGIVVGTHFDQSFETSGAFVPRDFIDRLVSWYRGSSSGDDCPESAG